MASFYHGNIKQLIVAFNGYFSDLHIVRREGDSVFGKPYQDLKIPIAFAPRAKWLHQIVEGSRDKQLKVTLPRIGFEITSFSYDTTRKKSRNAQIKCIDENGEACVVNTAVPYNVEISMNIVADNQEDCLQIIEQILPQFNPDLSISFKTVLGIQTSVPISLTSVSIQDEYEGSMVEDRLVIYTLTFVAKMEMYGDVTYVGKIQPPGIGIGGDPTDTLNWKDGQVATINHETAQMRLMIDGHVQSVKRPINSPGVYNAHNKLIKS